MKNRWAETRSLARTMGIVAAGLWLGQGCATIREWVKPHSQKAAEAFQQGRYDRAAFQYTRALKSEGDQYEFYVNRGRCYAQLGQAENALADFVKAEKVWPKRAPSLALDKAPVLVKLGKWEAARAEIAKARKETPSAGPRLLALQGQCFYALKRYDEALSAFDKALPGLEVGSRDALQCAWYRAFCLFRLERYAEARAAYLKGYLAAKKNTGTELSEDDWYWAGVMEDVNLDEKARNEAWGHLSRHYRKQKGVVLTPEER